MSRQCHDLVTGGIKTQIAEPYRPPLPGTRTVGRAIPLPGTYGTVSAEGGRRRPADACLDEHYAATPAPGRHAALAYCLSSSRFSGATSRATAPARAPVAISARRCGAITSDRISDANPRRRPV